MVTVCEEKVIKVGVAGHAYQVDAINNVFFVPHRFLT